MDPYQYLDQLIDPGLFIALAIIILMARDLSELAIDFTNLVNKAFYQIGEALIRLDAYLGAIIARQINKRTKD